MGPGYESKSSRGLAIGFLVDFSRCSPNESAQLVEIWTGFACLRVVHSASGP